MEPNFRAAIEDALRDGLRRAQYPDGTPEAVWTAPASICLNVSDEKADWDERFPDNVDDITWSESPAVEVVVNYVSEVEYNRAVSDFFNVSEQLSAEINENERFRFYLEESLRCLQAAKRNWAPHTTNSDADSLIARLTTVLEETS